MNNTQNNKKVSFHTLGCRLNFSETGAITTGFKQRGYTIVPFEEKAEIVFINTCTVTDGADSTCRNLIRKARKYSPEAKIVVAGCYAQMEANKIKQMKGVDLILGTSEKYKVFEYLKETDEQIIHIDKSIDFFAASTSDPSEGHTRAFVKIQDGCNYVCSYCIIPQARGRSKAISIKEAISEIRKVTSNGFKEIVLTGVNIGEYESSSNENLNDLITSIIKIEKVLRLRVSSVEPNTITKEYLKTLKSTKKFMPHFHIPLQSGDDEILQKMKRKYTVKEYKNIINLIISFFPNASIGADVICGFPGETDEQFQNTYNLMKELPITHFHVFPFSKRQNTVAAKMENQIQHHIKKERVNSLIHLGQSKLNLFSNDQVDNAFEVLFEKKDKNTYWEGYTPNFLKIKVKSTSQLQNMVRTVNVTSFKDNQLFGEIIF